VSGNALLKHLLRRKAKPERGKLDDLRIQTTAAIEERPLKVRPYGRRIETAPTVTTQVTAMIGSEHSSILIDHPHYDGLLELVTDFETGVMVERFSYHPNDLQPCIVCGTVTSFCDHKYGLRVCIDCDIDSGS
jgi:hypothetical protein